MLQRTIKDRLKDYCADRSVLSSSTSNVTHYGAYERVFVNRDPSYICVQEEDKYTASADMGNGLLKYPVGLLTVDEMVYAGGRSGSPNSEYYLYTSEGYWSMSPSYFTATNSIAYILRLAFDGSISNQYVYILNQLSIVPVVSLKPEAKVSAGTGEYNSPYVIMTE